MPSFAKRQDIQKSQSTASPKRGLGQATFGLVMGILFSIVLFLFVKEIVTGDWLPDQASLWTSAVSGKTNKRRPAFPQPSRSPSPTQPNNRNQAW
jgi:hypothetical protein